MKWLQIVLQLVNWGIILIVLNKHFLVKESSYHSSITFYSLPLPVIIAIVLVASLFLKVKKFNVIIAGMLLVVWLSRSFKIHIPDKINKSDLEIVFWNASRTNGFEAAFKLNARVPDVMVLVESKVEDLQMLKQHYANGNFYQTEQEVFIFSKTPIQIKTDSVSKYGSAVIHFKTRNINFYAIDVVGSTDVPRAWELGFVDKMVKETTNAVVLGDFNVPFESKYLNRLKANYKHAFNEKGNGFRETWFYNIPLLSLDHIWVSKNLNILKTKKHGTFKSDHSMLTTYIKSEF